MLVDLTGVPPDIADTIAAAFWAALTVVVVVVVVAVVPVLLLSVSPRPPSDEDIWNPGVDLRFRRMETRASTLATFRESSDWALMTDWPANVELLMADAAVAITDQRRRKKEFPTVLTLPSFVRSFVSFSQQITHKGKHTRELQQVEQQTTTRETLIPFLARTFRKQNRSRHLHWASVARTLSFQGIRPMIEEHVYN